MPRNRWITSPRIATLPHAERAVELARTLTAAAQLGYLEETIAYLLLGQGLRMKVSDEMETVSYCGFQITYVRGEGRYVVHSKQTRSYHAALDVERDTLAASA